MKSIVRFSLLLLFILSFAAQFAESNELILSSRFITRNDTLRLIYLDNDKEFKTDTLFAFIYSFSSEKGIPEGYNADLVRSGNSDTLLGYFPVPDNSIFALIKIGDGFDFDTGKGEFWDFFAVDADSSVFRNGYYRAALSYMGSYASNYRRTPDFKKAMKYFHKENSLYSDNLASVIGELSFNYELKNLTDKDYESQLERIIASARFDFDNEEEINVIIKSLRILGKNDKANDLEIKYAKHYPNSRIAKEKAFDKLADIDDFSDFIDQSILYLKKYKNSPYSEKLYLAIIQSYLQLNKFNDLKNFLKNNDIPSSIYYQVAYNLLENKELKLNIPDEKKKDYAKYLLRRSAEQKNIISQGNISLTPLEIKKINDLLSIESYFLLAKLYWEERQTDSLEAIVGKILLFDKRLYTLEQLYKMSIYSYEIGSYNLSLILSELYLTHDTTDIRIKNINKSSYNKVNTIDNYNDYYNTIKKQYEINKHKLCKQKYLEKNIEFPTIKTLDGVTSSLDIFQGRTLVIYTFGYFCDQCWNLFSDIESLYKKYGNEKDVLIFPVLLWDKDKKTLDEVNKFLDKNNLTVSIYFDYLNEVYKNLSITGVPTICIIGPGGFLNFRIEGIEPNKSIYDEVNECINYLNE